MTTRENKIRTGRFTSSQIHRLMGTPKPRATYIAECNMERRLERGLSNDHSARPTTWGHLAEKQAFSLLGTEYSLISQETIQHPEIDCWAGSPDGVTKTSVIDIKCPYTMKSFCELMEVIENGTVETLKNEYPEYFWQLVSNGILTGKDQAELIVYVPYYEELNDIRIMAEDEEIQQLHKVYWIANSMNDELPYLNKGGYYRNLNVFSFTIPQYEKDALIDQILECEKLLIPALNLIEN